MKKGTRRGFMLPAILLLTILIAGLAIMFQQRTLHRDVQTRRGRDRAIAKYLARAGIEWAKFSVREAARLGRGHPNPEIENGTLLPFLLDSRERVVEKVAQRTADKDDHRELLEQLLTPAAYEPLDRLEARYPGARIRMRLEVKAESLGGSPVVTDPVLKTVVIKVTSEASLGNVTEAFRIEEPIWVHSNLPRAASRFTLSVTGSDAAATGLHRIDAEGSHVEGDAPVVLFHRDADADPSSDQTWSPAGVRGEPMDIEVASAEELVGAAAGRGMVFLKGSTPTAGLPLAGAENAFGENHLLGIRKDGSGPDPFFEVTKMPELFEQFRAKHPDPAGVEQGAGLEALVLPFGTAGGDPVSSALPLEWTSRLKLYGTPARPSATVIVGGASRTLGLVTRVGVDRDATEADEAQQLTAAGVKLPEVEGIGAILPPLNESSFPALQTTPIFPAPAVPNRNRLADVDGDGIPETPVAGEELHDPVAIAAGEWQWSRLFKDYSEYATHMTRLIQVPANAFLQLCRMSREEVLEKLIATHVGSGGDAPLALEAFRLEDPVIRHDDPLHAKLGKDANVYLDGTDREPQEIADAITHGILQRYPEDRPITVRGQKFFEENFMKGGVLDLDGLLVNVIPEDVPNPPPLLEFDQPITVKPGSGGLLFCHRFKAPGLTNPGAGETFAPLVVSTSELILTGTGPYEACFQARTLTTDPDQPRGVIRGTLVMQNLPTPLAKPLVVQYDPRIDPTAPTAAGQYRLALPARSARTYEHLGEDP